MKIFVDGRVASAISVLLDYRHFKERSVVFCEKEALPVAPTVSSKQVLSISCLLSAASGQIQELPEMISMP